ncbi:MAG: hypothetical protein HKN73_12925 [Gemmatimonadetes bacterium]|nr:hypothetical protein [Gemmatimonadota bacterium]
MSVTSYRLRNGEWNVEWEFIAPMIMGGVLFLTIGGVLVLRPIATRLGSLLEVMARERAALPPEEIRHLRDTMETINQRLSLMEERQDFTERLLGRGEPSAPPVNEERTLKVDG